LALGDKIVSALNLQKSVDTLGRWKAHHLAELLLQLRDADSTKREDAAKRVEVFLQILGSRSKNKFRHSDNYDLKAIAPILVEVLEKSKSPSS
jgi:hypothetical protein